MQSNSITKVDKSQLIDHNFYSKRPAKFSVNLSRDKLMYKLNRALKLGNLHKIKVVIRFVTDRDFLETEATIWAVTDNYVMLKGGVLIPIENIIDVRF